MLDYIRKRSGGFISIFIVGAIALVFVFWGIGGQNAGDGVSIRMDDRSVPIGEYVRVQRINADSLRQQDPGLQGRALELAAARSALTQLVQRHVLGGLADGAGLAVPPESVVAAITANPVFQDDGRFSKARYEQVVTTGFRETVPGYEAALAEDMRIESAMRLIQGLNFVPRASLLEDYHTGEDEIALSYAFFPVSAYTAGLSPAEAELAAYYAADPERWRRPARVKVEYVVFDPEDYREGLTATEAEIEELYQEELPGLTRPPEAEVSHILIRFPSFTATEEEKAQTREKAEKALERLRTEDFAAVAREISEDPNSAPQGGELPKLVPGTMMQEFERAVFDSTPEQREGVIGPVESLFGYHLIKVRSFAPETVQTLAQASGDLREAIVARKSRVAAAQALERLLERAQARGRDADLKALAAEDNLQSRTSDFFTASEPPEFLGGSADEAAKAVALPVGLVSEPVDAPDHLALYVPLELQESFVPDLSDPAAKGEVTAAWVEEEASRRAEAEARGLIASRGDRALDAAAKSLGNPGVQTGSSGFFRRLRFFAETQPPVSQADLARLAEAIFLLRRVGDTAPDPVPTYSPEARGWLVVSLNGFRAASDEAFDATLAGRRAQAGAESAQRAFAFWIYARTMAVSLILPRELQNQLDEGEAAEL
ncbi:MAG: SurA N-terminal domain-containing protein [Deltaproteobacteria bacterium]|nr:SurA N-terminal domain-containing protein [Deltaproteobacteria bacterium]